jgi:uncharacterized protein (DUF362 family)
MKNSNDQTGFSRREFFSRALMAGIGAAAIGGTAYKMYDGKGPGGSEPGLEVTLRDYSVPVDGGKSMAIVKGESRAATVNRAIDLLGGIHRFVKPGERVLIKPNVAFTSAPSAGATTDPELVAELVRLCYKNGQAREVLVADNPINDPESCFTYSGIARACAAAGAKLIVPRTSHFRPTTLKDGKLIRDWPLFYEPMAKVDKVIGVAPVKNHVRSGASMTMKNWYGLLGGRRNLFHQDINTIITELAMLVKPTLVVLDGTMVMMRNGPTGGSVADLERRNTMIVGTDQVAVDSFGATLLGLKPSDLPFLEQAQKAGCGVVDYASLKPLMADVAGEGRS